MNRVHPIVRLAQLVNMFYDNLRLTPTPMVHAPYVLLVSWGGDKKFHLCQMEYL